MQSKIHTIIIGSGIAGMAAAHQLAEEGKEVLVLQSNSYIGGRLKSIPMTLANDKKIIFQEGANWIHGSNHKHPITQLSKDIQNLKTIQTDDEQVIIFDEAGKQVTDKVDEQYKPYQKFIDKMQDQQGLTAEEALKKLNKAKLTNKYFMYNVSIDIQFQTSAPFNHLGAEYGQDDSFIKGKQMLVMSGYQAFAEHLGHHKNIKILLNHPVSEVFNQGNGNNKVRCQNGQIFQASNIIIAVPIGVLKSNLIKFNPQLPKWKKEAIQKIHFGNVCKILIIFKNKCIINNHHYIGVVDDDINQRGCATYFLNLAKLANVPAIMTFGLGVNADHVENMAEDTLKQIIAKRLRVFGDKSFSPADFDIVRTKWRNDPYFRGTYSYSGVQTKPKNWENMAKPIFELKWYFCGQHTHSKYRGTVHGAYLSGKDTAQSIIEQYQNGDWKYKAKSDN